MKKYTWDIVNDKSTITLKAKYHLFGNITARFSKFSGNIITGEAFSHPEIYLNIDAGTIYTQDTEQDQKLRSSAYFSALDYPLLTFSSVDKCVLSSGGIQELTGDLCIKEITREVTMIVNFSSVKQFSRGARAHFYLYGNINLREWHLGIPNDFGISEDALIITEMTIVRRTTNQPH